MPDDDYIDSLNDIDPSLNLKPYTLNPRKPNGKRVKHTKVRTLRVEALPRLGLNPKRHPLKRVELLARWRCRPERSEGPLQLGSQKGHK